jgi:HEAT repeat protein
MLTRAEDVAALVERMPALDKRGTLTGPKWAEAAEVFDAILEGGKESVAAAVALLKEVDNGEDWKARYVLHGIAVYVCRPDRREKREPFTLALASHLGGTLPKAVQGFLIRQLQVAGGKEVVEALGKLLTDEELYEPAALALQAIRHGAAEQFRQALPRASGKARLTILQALGVLKDGASLETFRKAAGEADGDVRRTAVWALANLGAAEAIDTVLKAADAAEIHERNRATHAALLLAERLRSAGRKDEPARIYRHLRDTRKDDSEKYVREAADRALAELDVTK